MGPENRKISDKEMRSNCIRYLIDHAYSSDNYFEFVSAIALLIPKRLREQLKQLVYGPVWDGDIISKSYRGELFDLNLAVRVCVNGEQGFTGAPYIAYSIVNRWKETESAPEVEQPEPREQ